MDGKKIEPRILRGISVIILVLFAFFIGLCVFNEASRFNVSNEKNVFDGHAVLDKMDFENGRPIALNGEWDVYEGIYLEQYDAAALANSKLMALPSGKITQFHPPTTYRVEIDAARGATELTLYIPNFHSNISIYVNGHLQSQSQKSGGYWSLKLLDEKFFDISLEGETTNELVLSVGKGAQEDPLYKRSILIGSFDSVYTYAYLSMANTMFIFGLLIILTISGYMFLFLYPKHRIISLITLLDSFITFHVLFGLGNIFDYIGDMIGGIVLGDAARMSFQIFLLMVAGIFGCLLAHYLFDKEGRAPKPLWRPLPYMYAACAIVFALRLDWLESFGIYVILALYLFTLGSLFFQMKIYWQKNKNAYAMFQIFKTTYFGVVVMLDVLFLPQATNVMYFAYAYMMFLLMHLFIRLYDNQTSYNSVDKLNRNLEQLVEERTAELVRTNKILSEMSIRDALTNTYNRLYFERYIEAVLAKFDPARDALHLCMFDLDFFKNINDEFGHDAGDRQLIQVVKTIDSILGQNAMLARVGGEEFMIVFTDCITATVVETIERIRLALEANAKEDPKSTTASFGVARYHEGMKQKELLKAADKCLYMAKEQGRNRLVCLEDDAPTDIA